MRFGQLERENKQFEKARKYAMLHSNYTFIKLILKNYARRNVAGIHVLHATPYYNRQKRKEDFAFEVRGGNATFEPDESSGGEHVDYFLDDEHNRKFLASCYKAGYWIIEDKKIDRDIRKMAEKIPEDIVGTPPEIMKLAERISNLQKRLKVCSDDEASKIQSEISALQDDVQRIIEGPEKAKVSDEHE